MRTINVFVDTSTVNRFLDIDVEKANDAQYEEDRSYLKKIVNYVEKGIVRLIVNPSVQQEIENTSDIERKEHLLAVFNQFQFTPYNKTLFPKFQFPGTFVTEEEGEKLEELCIRIPRFEKDKKVFLDALSNSDVKVLLTTDRTHLADRGLDSLELLIFTPKQLVEYLQNEI